ncbi:MAG: DUF4003 family protein [Clostridia bacterium]|nr:DUF4003 family protein [Clostridia bacterium]
MEYSQIYPVCANIFCARGLTADRERLEACKALIKEKTGIFSNFPGVVRPPVACMLALRENPSAMMEETLTCYELLKERFWGSSYLALVSFLLADMTEPGEAPEKALRGRTLYDLMKKQHPFLTSSEDSVFAVLMAFSDKTDDELIDDMERCYALLRKRFSSGNALQSVSHVLALASGAAEQKVSRLEALYDTIRDMGGKYGKYHELATLAALSIVTEDAKAVASDMLEVDSFLAQQKGYGLLGIDRKTRMMHAAMIVSDEAMPRNHVNTAALTGTIAVIAAQQAAMCAVIASSATASNASHAN